MRTMIIFRDLHWVPPVEGSYHLRGVITSFSSSRFYFITCDDNSNQKDATERKAKAAAITVIVPQV